MSRTANCWDNAAMESFFATLTKECINRRRFQTRQEARSAIFEYLECFYNPIRLHSTLQYVSPLAFEQAYASKMSSFPSLESTFFWVNSTCDIPQVDS